jgi:tRNA A-37 threonylcarbamoyl transferase component Bud32
LTPERYARIKQLFANAVVLDPAQRDAYLAKACRDEPELRSEVEALLRHDDSRTIIRAIDQTVADFSRQSVAVAPRRTLATKLRGWGSLTKHLSPKGFLALGGLIACILLAFLGYIGSRSVNGLQSELRRESLNEIVDGKVLSLRMWLEHETNKVESWARSSGLRDGVDELVRLANQSSELPSDFARSPLQQDVREAIVALAGREVHCTIWDRRHFVIADTISGGERVGQSATPWGSSILASVFSGQSQLFAFDETRSITTLEATAQVEPHVAIVVPLRNRDQSIIAALQIHDDDSRETVKRILQIVQWGETGESYVFNEDGLMLSPGRFRKQLREIGLIPDDADANYRVYLHDPGGDLTAGYRSDEPLSSRPLTRMARLCIAGHDGDDLEGYRDYRGVQVVGAWRWLEDLQIGVATEMEIDEAEPGMRWLIWEAWAVLGMFALCMGIALYSYYSVHRLRQDLGENRKLGQYRLEKQIGEGGMGKVFKAQHELLRRPTAIKLLKPEFMDAASLARFEREARLVSQLEHFNTVRVFDYGVTPEGLFYLVMEYIDGWTLSELVELDGPLSPARTVFLLQQICYSLREAHGSGLVHRDLKPGNIMVCERGGQYDVAKTLDFGLVKPIDATGSQEITSTNLVAGTPHYIPPERLRDPDTNDPRSDLYSLGAVAYFLLTGQDAVQGSSIAEILFHIVNTPPPRASAHTDQQIPAALDDLIYSCMSKDPEIRPASAAEMIAALRKLEDSCPWTESQAEAWWTSKLHLLKPT